MTLLNGPLLELLRGIKNCTAADRGDRSLEQTRRRRPQNRMEDKKCGNNLWRLPADRPKGNRFAKSETHSIVLFSMVVSVVLFHGLILWDGTRTGTRRRKAASPACTRRRKHIIFPTPRDHGAAFLIIFVARPPINE